MTRTRKPIMALAYDFDGTLAPGNMQDRDFIPALQSTTSRFWMEVKEHSKEHDMDEILAYMELMVKRANEKDVQIRRQDFVNFGRKIVLFPGAVEWFKRVTDLADNEGIKLEHYIISSGLREMIAGTKINKYFKRVYASGFRYDQHNVAVWPALAINYTNKTQYLFRINKGIENSYDNTEINQFTPPEDRRIPFENMIYIGDGDTDIPCMKMIKHQGGYAIAVYQPKKRNAKNRAYNLVDQKRADYVFPANYKENSSLFKAVTDMITKIAAENRLLKAGKPK